MDCPDLTHSAHSDWGETHVIDCHISHASVEFVDCSDLTHSDWGLGFIESDYFWDSVRIYPL